MTKKTLVHKSHVLYGGETYPVLVYRSHNGRLFAETPLDSEDIIINDAGSLVEVLAKHEKMLPLALTAREIRAKPGNLHVTGLEVDR